MDDLYVTPYLPEEAQEAIAKRRASGIRAVFKKAFITNPEASCKNCQDIGFVYASFAVAGPFPAPPNSIRVVTWFDGDGTAGKGWYVIETQSWPCPHCEKGKPLPGDERKPRWWEKS